MSKSAYGRMLRLEPGIIRRARNTSNMASLGRRIACIIKMIIAVSGGRTPQQSKISALPAEASNHVAGRLNRAGVAMKVKLRLAQTAGAPREVNIGESATRVLSRVGNGNRFAISPYCARMRRLYYNNEM